MPVDIAEPFASIMARMVAAKPQIEKEHADLLGQRYDLADHPAQGVTMSRGKPVQTGVRAKLPAGTSWDSLAALSPDQIRDRISFRAAFCHCRTPTMPKAAWCFRILRLTS